MKKNRASGAAIASIGLLLTLGVIPEPFAAQSKINSVMAQSVTDPPAATDPNRETVRIDGSSSMRGTNQIRIQQIERRSAGTDVQTNYNGTNAALQSVLNGQTDLAAIGRPLTAQEQAQGLIAAPLKRQKIAIVVGSANPFTGDLTFVQFAKIFRGEIKDWSEVGGPPGRIQLIDRPATSDTRQALENYEIFQQAPFVAAANAVKLTDDSTAAVIPNLGTNGISYAISDRVTNTPGVRIVPMHKILPSDPRYPFSQPLAYVYKGPTPNPAAAAFLGLATTAAVGSQAAVPATPAATPAAVAPSSETTEVVSTQDTADTGFPWWSLLILPIGGLLWLLTRSRPAPIIAAVATPKVVPIPPAPPVVAVAPVAPVVPVAPVIANVQSPTISLYEERLLADKSRQKVQEVAIGKRIETVQGQVSIPVEQERVTIERIASTDTNSVVGDVPFGVGESRIETYGEVPEIRKEAFVREEIKIHKEIERETVTAQEQVRHQELDIQTQRSPEESLGQRGTQPSDGRNRN